MSSSGNKRSLERKTYRATLLPVTELVQYNFIAVYKGHRMHILGSGLWTILQVGHVCG